MVGLTQEKTDEQRDIKVKHKQGRNMDYIYCHADIHIYYIGRALTALKRYTSTALKRYTSIAQADHLDILCTQ